MELALVLALPGGGRIGPALLLALLGPGLGALAAGLGLAAAGLGQIAPAGTAFVCHVIHSFGKSGTPPGGGTNFPLPT